MKCQVCGKEYDEKQYVRCPRCYRKQTKKERVFEIIWEWIFFILTIAIFLLSFLGFGYLLGHEAAIVLFFPLFTIWGFGLVKKEERRKQELKVKIRRLLENHEFDSIDGRWKYEIIKEIEQNK